VLIGRQANTQKQDSSAVLAQGSEGGMLARREDTMKYGLDVPINGDYADPRRLAVLAAEAERAGWDGFFLQDVFLGDDPILDPWVALEAVATATQRIRLGIFLTPLPRRQPWEVARQAVTMDHLAGGRLIFGAALGNTPREFTAFGADSDPRVRGDRLDEGLAILAGLWTGEDFSFHGRHYTVDNVKFLPRPRQLPRIPVWVAGGWPARKPFRRAARWDGVYAMTYNQQTKTLLTPEEVAEIAAYVRAHRDSSDHFDLAINAKVPADPHAAAAYLQPYATAGATWWLALDPGSLAEYEAYISQGPPRP
jgi:alkanesulfonate monooxygenase SsuD/methylene tetrahydromethanopterin reductase-like flavin-dependent oxidoreductase (luciferase family)